MGKFQIDSICSSAQFLAEPVKEGQKKFDAGDTEITTLDFFSSQRGALPDSDVRLNNSKRGALLASANHTTGVQASLSELAFP